MTLNVGQPPQGGEKQMQAQVAWLVQAIYAITRHLNAIDISNITDGYVVTGTLTEKRDIDAASATSTDIRNILATLVNDLHKRGQNGV